MPDTNQDSGPSRQSNGERGQGRERARRRGHRRGERKTVAMPAYITREIPYYEFLSEEGLVRLEDQADWLIQEVGLEFRDDPEALEIWRAAGADVKDTRVRLPRGMARDLCKTAPTKFTQHARNPARSVEIGEESAVFAPVYGPPFVRDLEKGRRYGSIEDFEKLVKLTYMLPALHHSGFVTCEPCDIPVNKRHFDMLYAHMRWSDKPSLGAITEKSRAEDSVAMARILHGEAYMEDHCVIMGNVNTNSPLLVDRVVTEAIRTYSAANQGMIVAPFILGGAMGPVTTAASIAQAYAEAMMCCAYSQLVRPGSPFILANFVLHAAGWLEGGLATGFEKLLIDADRLGAYQKLLAGIALDDNGLGRNAYDDVEPAGHFLGSAHTMANYETAYYDAEMSNSDSFEQWQEDGSKDTERRAFERWNQMLNEYEAPPLDEAKDEELKAFIAQRKQSMKDAWY